MIIYNTDCPYCNDNFDQYCNLFKSYRNCDRHDCEVLKILKENKIMKDIIIGEQEENEQLKQQIEKMKCCRNCKHWNVPDHAFDSFCEECDKCKNYSLWELAE